MTVAERLRPTPSQPGIAVMVVGVGALASSLRAWRGLDVREAAPGRSLRSALDDVTAGPDPFATVVIAGSGSDTSVETTALALVRSGYRIIVVNGVGGHISVCHPEVPTLTAPFSPGDVVAAIERLAGPVTVDDAVVPFDLAWDRPPERCASPLDSGAAPGGAGWFPVIERAAADEPHRPSGLRPGSGRADAAPSPGPPMSRRRAGSPQVLAFTCPKGGSGKTSLSLNFASFLGAALAGRGRKVVWVDGNLQQADGARYLGADERTSRSIVDLVGRPELDDEAVLAALTGPEGTGQAVWALFGPTFKADADPRLVTAELYRQSVVALRRHFDYIVVDTPVAEHYDDFFTDFVLSEADQLVVVVPPLLPVVRGVREWLELQSHPVAAGGSALPAAKVRVVLNMDSPRSGCPVETVRDAWLTRWSWAGAVPYDPAWTAATNDGALLATCPGLAAPFADLVRLTTGEIVEVGRGGPGRSGWRERIRAALWR